MPTVQSSSGVVKQESPNPTTPNVQSPVVIDQQILDVAIISGNTPLDQVSTPVNKPFYSKLTSSLFNLYQVCSESYGIALQTSKSITLFRTFFSFLQSTQFLFYGLCASALATGYKTAQSIFEPSLLFPITIAFGIRLFTGICDSRAQTSEKVQNQKFRRFSQDRVRDLTPETLEGMNNPKVSRDHKLIIYGGVWELSHSSSQLISGVGAITSTALGLYFIATTAPLAITLAIAPTIIYQTLKSLYLSDKVNQHEETVMPDKLRAMDVGWSRVWSNMVRLLTVLNAKSHLDQVATKAQDTVTSNEVILANKQTKASDVGQFVNFTAGTLATLALFESVFTGALSFDKASFLFLIAMPIFLNSVETLTNSLVSLSRHIPTIYAIKRLKSHRFKELENKGKSDIQWSQRGADVIFKDICFAYPAQIPGAKPTPLLQNTTMEIKSGEIVAIVGDNGSGKSSALKLLERAQKPFSGKITVNGTNVFEASDDNFFHGTSVLPQNPESFPNFTIRQFLSWARPDNPDPILLEKIMKELGLEEMLSETVEQENGEKLLKFPLGLDTLMGANVGGVDLSGGQKALLYCAYMLYKQPKLIIFDEPTQGMSKERTNNFFNIIFNRMEDILGYKPTIILVVHDLDQIPKADKVYYLNNQTMDFEGGEAHGKLVQRVSPYTKWYCNSIGYDIRMKDSVDPKVLHSLKSLSVEPLRTKIANILSINPNTLDRELKKENEKLNFGYSKAQVMLEDNPEISCILMEHAHEFSPPKHKHTNEDELFIVESGEYVFEISGQLVFAKPGDLVLAKKGEEHTFQCLSKKGGSCYVVTAPSGFERFVRAMHTINAEDIQNIATEYGIQFTGPSMTAKQNS